MALISGSLYGINIAPVIYVQDNSDYYTGAPPDGLPYAFSHFFGAFIMCTVIFVAYALFKKNRPVINPSIPLPALLTGLIWGVAQVLLLNATSRLSAAISYPIAAMLPGCVAALWSIFVFDEVEVRLLYLTFLNKAISERQEPHFDDDCNSCYSLRSHLHWSIQIIHSRKNYSDTCSLERGLYQKFLPFRLSY